MNEKQLKFRTVHFKHSTDYIQYFQEGGTVCSIISLLAEMCYVSLWTGGTNGQPASR